ncbi:MAG: DEAD/DEAH box helicase [Nitrospiraceae bacterium]|nr:DEAD/DEAH box helicase [Nitrospiraceae bacterium]
MDTNELERLLLEQPVSLLHRLARGRVSRHFRSGKRRLVEMLLRTTAENRPGLISDLTALIEEQARKREAQPPSLPRPQPRREKPARPSPFQRQPKTEEPSHHHEPPVSLHEWLSGIGVPPVQPFVPDPWQIDALAKLVDFDVIVSVPTGSGKTYVAIEATKRAMQDNRTVIYTSPLKALSNTKFTEFSRLFGADQVGILTGDRRENAQAPLLIMTTEILRNLLYDAAGGEIDVRLDTLGLVIMDESQYLADPERGVVWEETLIFCPGQARLLLLSASIGNPQDIADWLTAIRPQPCALIRHTKRTVPLRAGYLHPNGKLTPLFRTAGIPYGQPYLMHPEAKRLFAEYEEETGTAR